MSSGFLEVPKLATVLVPEYNPNKKAFVIIANEEIKDLAYFQSHGRCVFYESWMNDPLDSLLFDYFFCDTRKEGAMDYLKCNQLEKYNIIYYTTDKKIHRNLSAKFRDNENVNVLSSIPNNNIKPNFDKLLMFGASVKDLILDENVQKATKSLFSCFSRK